MQQIIAYLTSTEGFILSNLVVMLGWGVAKLVKRVRRTGGLWPRVARLLAKPRIAEWLIRRSLHNPYTHIYSADGKSLYMGRFWLFNPYSRKDNAPIHRITVRLFGWAKTLCFPISIRVHNIRREDGDRHLHSHPWNARTVILKGHYIERRRMPDGTEKLNLMRPGSTARLGVDDWHRIVEVGPDGAWTLFISGPYREVWGFLVEGRKVPWRTYLGLEG